MKELNVKVGDKVLINEDRLATVTKVTPTGRFETSKTGTSKFNKYGREIGKDIWYRNDVRFPTEEDYKRLKENAIKDRAIRLMGTYHVKNITIEQAEQIVSILGRKEAE
jgi:hypothetical protein